MIDGITMNKSARRNQNEIWRRLFLLGFLIASAWSLFYTPLIPLYVVTVIDFQQMQEREITGFGYITERRKQLAAMPLEQYIVEITDNRAVRLDSYQWETFYNNVEKTATGYNLGRNWSNRIVREPYHYGLNDVYFRVDESPLDIFEGYFKDDFSPLFLFITDKDGESHLKLSYYNISQDKFLPGGYSGRKPPSAILYPYRFMAPILLLIGMIFYALLPWPRKMPDAIAFKRTRIIAGDIGLLVLFSLFFSLPMLIMGNFLNAFATWQLQMVFFPLYALCTGGLLINGTYSSKQYVIKPDKIILISYKGYQQIYPDKIAYYQPAVKKLPRWMIRLMYILILLSAAIKPTSSNIGDLGRALLADSAAYQGVKIAFHDGSSQFIWFTDQLGNLILPGIEKIPIFLEQSGVSSKQEVVLITSLFTDR